MNEFRTRQADIAAQALQVPDTPLGPYGEIPAAYAVYKVTPDHQAQKAQRTHFVYASAEYCKIANCELSDIIGCSHLEVVKSEGHEWARNCYRAAILGETVNGIDYSALTQGWVCYNIAPASVEGCCTCAFIHVNDQERARQISVDARTTQTVSEMLRVLAGENGYELAMNGMLEMAAEVVRPDRIIVFECRGEETEHTFEWCAEGIESQLGTVYRLPTAVLNAWFKSVVKDPVALVPDVSGLARFSPPLYEWCVENNIERLMAAPFFNEGNVVGFLGAYNYRIDDTIDVNRVFGAVSSFIGAKIENHRLIEHLAWAGEHDDLTGLLNRRGASAVFAELIDKNPNVPYVLMLADIDNFKDANDLFGHSTGDRALEAMAQAMREAFPEDAILCRMGGDEFLVMLIGENAARADELIERFGNTRIEFDHDGELQHVTISIGYAAYPEQGQTRNELYTKADTALYEVKHAGKSGFKKYAPQG